MLLKMRSHQSDKSRLFLFIGVGLFQIPVIPFHFIQHFNVLVFAGIAFGEVVLV